MITRRNLFKALALIALTPHVPKLLAEKSDTTKPRVYADSIHEYRNCTEVYFLVRGLAIGSTQEALNAVIDHCKINLRGPVPLITITVHAYPGFGLNDALVIIRLPSVSHAFNLIGLKDWHKLWAMHIAQHEPIRSWQLGYDVIDV
jgi:hypothetical protein